MRHGSFKSLGAGGFHRVAYIEWGDPANERVLICVHGLTRNARDFDTLAQALAGHYRVICPDVVGRGASDWLSDKSCYAYPQYLADMAALIAHSGASAVHWVGTSMGGLIGMLMAAQAGTPITRMVMNDIGPLIPLAALERIRSYVGEDPRFDDIQALDAYLGEIYAPFGPFTESQWQGLVGSSSRRREDGSLGLAYDPGIAMPLHAAPSQDIDLWSTWDAVTCPVLVLRGAQSDLLLPETAREMTTRGPRAELVEIPGVGHPPMLMNDEQIEIVKSWLLAG